MARPKNAHTPPFRSVEEEAEYWDNHSPLDQPDQWLEAKEARVERPLAHTLAVRLDADTLGKLASIGRRIGIGPSTLARMWLMERLAQMEDQEQHRAGKEAKAS